MSVGGRRKEDLREVALKVSLNDAFTGHVRTTVFIHNTSFQFPVFRDSMWPPTPLSNLLLNINFEFHNETARNKWQKNSQQVQVCDIVSRGDFNCWTRSSWKFFSSDHDPTDRSEVPPESDLREERFTKQTPKTRAREATLTGTFKKVNLVSLQRPRLLSSPQLAGRGPSVPRGSAATLRYRPAAVDAVRSSGGDLENVGVLGSARLPSHSSDPVRGPRQLIFSCIRRLPKSIAERGMALPL